jgi:hypothetical protein
MEFQLSEINDSLSDKIKAVIHGYTIALVRVKSEQSKENIFGSGTLVSLGGEYGILTAAHVTEEIKGMNEVGFCIGHYRHVKKTQHLSISNVGWSGEITPEGPDISLIRIPPTEIGWIKACKSFYPLDDTKFEDKVDFSNKGHWFISGYIGTWTISKSQNGGSAGTHGFRPFIGIAESVEDYSVRGNFDYCTINVQYESNKDNPENFEGFSGGGLWKGKFRRDPDEKLHVDDFILQGVAYYQTSIQCKSRKIICHAHRSISTAASHWQKYIEEKKAQ